MPAQAPESGWSQRRRAITQLVARGLGIRRTRTCVAGSIHVWDITGAGTELPGVLGSEISKGIVESRVTIGAPRSSSRAGRVWDCV